MYFADTNKLLLDIASGPHHKGLLKNIFSAVDQLETYTKRLRNLRKEKQRGTQEPGKMELVAMTIVHRYEAREDKVWDLVEEKIDMTNAAEREAWLERKAKVIKDLMGWTLTYLNDMDAREHGWKEKEVGELTKDWEQRWKTYAAMGPEDLKAVGWILDV